jgi:hypothetical protein
MVISREVGAVHLAVEVRFMLSLWPKKGRHFSLRRRDSIAFSKPTFNKRS